MVSVVMQSSIADTDTLGPYRYECTALSTAIQAAQYTRRMHDVCEFGIASLQAFARHTLMLRHPSFDNKTNATGIHTFISI